MQGIILYIQLFVYFNFGNYFTLHDEHIYLKLSLFLSNFIPSLIDCYKPQLLLDTNYMYYYLWKIIQYLE